MKKILLTGVLMLACAFAIGQENDSDAKNEFKLNVLALLLGRPELGYEHIINEESSFGIDMAFSIDHEDMDFRFSATPYYRFYFGKQPAAGFFAEGFGMINHYEFEYGMIGSPNRFEQETNFALGIGLGGKFITNSNFTFEILGGIGRNFGAEFTEDIEPRFGVSFGKRF